jgi:hypothetical protein
LDESSNPASQPEFIERKKKRSLEDTVDDTASFKTAKNSETSSPSKKAIADEIAELEKLLQEEEKRNILRKKKLDYSDLQKKKKQNAKLQQKRNQNVLPKKVV